MCCQETKTLELPAEVIEALARYRKLLDDRGWDWGDEQIDVARWARFSQYGPLNDAFMATGDWAKAIRSVIGTYVPSGVAVETIELDGADGVFTVALDGRTLEVEGAIRTSVGAELRLSSPRCARWS